MPDQECTIKVPVHMIKQIKKVNKKSRQLKQVLGREPTDEEIAEKLKWHSFWLRSPVDRVKAIKKLASEPVCYNTSTGEEITTTLGELVELKH